MHKPKFTLVGAGPGDPELITLKGVKALAAADVVLYDALLDKRLLEHAFSDGRVVRLKGGDPFVFGRGTEEIDYAASFGIEIEMIPGITSSTSVPANLGISVTQRHVSESFWVITGTTSDMGLSNDLLHAAQTTATVVVMMGFGKLNEIVDVYQSLNKGHLPVAVIQNGTTDNERSAVGTMDTIEQEVRANQLSTPAIIVIGEVVSHSHKLKAVFEEVSNKEVLRLA